MRKLTFLTIMISIGVGIGIVWFFLGSYDFTPITKENKFPLFWSAGNAANIYRA